MSFSIDNISPNRLAISSWCYGSEYYAGHFSLLDLPELASRLGISNIEFNDFMLPVPRFSRVAQPAYHLVGCGENDAWRYRISTLKKLKQKLDQNQQKCVCWTMNTDFSNSRSWFGSSIYLWWGIQAAQILKVDYLRIILGGDEQSSEADSQIAQKVSGAVQRVLEQLPNTSVILENHWGLSTQIGRMTHIYAQARGRLKAAEQNRFGICLDPVNMLDAPLEPQWDRLIPHTKHAHLKLKKHSGEAIDLDLFVSKLRQSRYDGYFVIEDPDLLALLPPKA